MDCVLGLMLIENGNWFLGYGRMVGFLVMLVWVYWFVMDYRFRWPLGVSFIMEIVGLYLYMCGQSLWKHFDNVYGGELGLWLVDFNWVFIVSFDGNPKLILGSFDVVAE